MKYFYKKKIAKLCAIGLTTIVLINMSFFAYIKYKEIISFINITKDIKELKNTKDLKLKLGTDGLYGYYYNLNDNGVKYTIVKNIPEDKIRYKYSWRVMIQND